MSFYIPDQKEVIDVIPDYNTVEKYKVGGYKAVYRATILNKVEALKLVYIPNANELRVDEEIIEASKKRVLREIDIIKRCSSKYVVKLGGLKPTTIKIKDNEYIAYSEEFINGNSLDDIIRNNFTPDEKELKELTSCMVDAIKSLWALEGSIHRDIKPLNIIKTNYSERKFILFDLGIAFKVNETPITPDPSAIPGTLFYLAPEMFNPNFRESIDYRSDLYSLAVTIYEYATRKNPFLNVLDDTARTISKIIRYNPESINSFRPDLGFHFSNLINQWLKKQPYLRPSNWLLINKILES